MSNPEQKPETSEDTKIKIKDKINYYFSDENLKNDTFLYEKIKSNIDGYVDIETILKFSDIKENNWTKEDIIKGVELSDTLELDSTKEKIRRKNNLKLPELTLLSNKRKLEKDINKENNNINNQNNQNNNSSIILKISCNIKPSFPNKNIFDEFKKLNPELNIEYQHFQDTIGYMSILLKKEQNFENMKLTDKFKIGDIEFNVIKCINEDLNNFWKEHRADYEAFIKQSKNEVQKPKTQEKIKLIFGGKRYCNVGLVKMETKKILNKYKINDKLNETDKAFVLDLFKYHDEYNERIKDLDYIMVGSNERFRYLRNFYIIDKNQNKINCSPKKCIDNLVDRMNKQSNQ